MGEDSTLELPKKVEGELLIIDEDTIFEEGGIDVYGMYLYNSLFMLYKWDKYRYSGGKVKVRYRT